VTWLNAVNDQFAGIGAVVVPGTVRDSLYILGVEEDRNRILRLALPSVSPAAK
jgi:hypothetical protein